MRLRIALIAVVIATVVPLANAQRPAKRAAGDVIVRGVETYSAPVLTYEVVASWPHDRDAFTQGLIWRDGTLYESTGLYGRSSLREVAPETGEVRRSVDVSSQYFAEGLTELDGKLYQLTWQHQKGFVYDFETFALLGEFSYTGEGWGLTTDGHSLIMSDGTDTIRYLDPETFAVQRTIRVSRDGVAVRRLNELEYIDGQIYANVWLTDYIARIDPFTGRVTAWIDMTGLLPPGSGSVDVLNGIAYDMAGDRILVTGKLWPRIFEVRFVPKSQFTKMNRMSRDEQDR